MADLSPIAWQVYSAASFAKDHGRSPIAAALRALADHRQEPITDGQPIDHWNPDDRTRQELRNIAAELVGSDA